MNQISKIDELYRLEDQLGQLEAKIQSLRAEVKATAVPDHEFQGWDGPVRLSQLFGDHKKLIVIHNMGTGCRYCSMWADGLNGLLGQLEQVTAVAMINHDPVERQKAASKEREWRFKMADAGQTSFTEDMGFFRREGEDAGMLPGTSTFTLDGEGTIRRFAMAYFGPHDKFNPVYSFLELLPRDAEDGFEPL
ncbi:AhpC/TSA family protein [Labrenzia sp. THAF82]|uniref:DUF899 family protein n=1 Tax=Labrenzia sp. THAF82 TaxID=2587861 RepID=UPI0012AA6EDA|nr:DUF899 family protein [Labrenzia sp. THAF82]QFT32216.1 AhpC/TSA family protein [Labrenzia sp. THAF82]